MAQVSTSTTNFDKSLQALINKKLEERMRAPLPYLMPGSFIPAKFVKGSNGTMRFLNIPDLSVVTGTPSAGTPPWLTEGTPPTAEDIVIGYEEFSVNQAGRVIKLTDVAMMESPWDLIEEATDLVVRNMFATADKRVSDVVNAGTNVIYADASDPQVNAATTDIRNTDVLTSRDIRRGVALLRGTNVPTFGDGFYRGILHPFATFDVEGDSAAGGWVDAQRYASPENLISGELGRYGGVRWFHSTNAGVSSYGATGAVFGDTTVGEADDETYTTGSAHGLAVGDRIRFISRTGGTGTAALGTTVFVKTVPSSTTFTLSLTSGGATEAFTTDVTASTWGRAIDAYHTIIHGPGAWVFGSFGSQQTYFTPPGGHDDPLHQSALVGWKAFIGAMLIGEGTSATNVSDPRYIIIKSAASLDAVS